MYFDFEDSHLETPTVESAISWRERTLVSVFVHLLAVGLVVFVPRLGIVQEAAARRAARLAALAELAQQRQQDREGMQFVFVEPFVDFEALDALESADASDMDRSAAAPERAEIPTNELPFALGNTSERVEAEQPSEGPDAVARRDEDVGLQARLDEPDRLGEDREPGGGGREELTDGTDGLRLGLGPTPTPGAGSREVDVEPTLLRQALRNLERFVQRESFNNPSGGAGQYGPWIQFDTKGVEFGPWIRRFKAQIEQNWLIPKAQMTEHGHTVITFNVHRDGTISDLAVRAPSAVQGFNHAAVNALRWSNPTYPLPEEYPLDRAFFTVTFFYNETPPYY